VIASEFEYRHRFAIVAFVFVFAYAFYNLDRLTLSTPSFRGIWAP
jgi:hypothetical protein